MFKFKSGEVQPAQHSVINLVDTPMVRLDQEQYLDLVKKVQSRIGVPSTDLEAAYLLGVQSVLTKLREGYVVGGY